MERVLKVHIGDRYQAGTIRDWPKPTWDQICKNLGKPLDRISMPVSEAIKSGGGAQHVEKGGKH